MRRDNTARASVNRAALVGGDGRVLLRPSGTEPLIRVMVEGREAAVVAAKANSIADIVRAQVHG